MLWIRWLSFFLVCLASQAPLSALSLAEAYEAARESRSLVIASEIEEKISRKLQNQAIAELLPSISVYSQSDWQDQVRGNDTTNRFGQSYQHSAAFEGTQQVFQGGKEYLALYVAGILKRQRRYETRLAELELYELVSDAFFELLRLEMALENLREQQSALESREKVLRQRAKIGKSKKTDVIGALSELARIKAEFLKLQADRQQAQRKLLSLIGRNETVAIQEDLKISDLTDLNKDDVLLSPQVQVSQAKSDFAKAQSKLSLGNFLPTVEATGRYYLDRAGLLEASKWDIGLTAEWEFFSGGRDWSERQIAQLRMRQALVELNNVQDDQAQAFRAEQEILQLRRETLKAFGEASRLAKENYESQKNDFQNGLVSNLDVLQALDTYLEVKRSHDEERVALKASSIRLQLIAGRLP